jgi:hypothetical protein
VPVLNCLLSSMPDIILSYAGFGPGQELIPHFLALLAFAGAALMAIVQWPIVALWRCFSRLRGRSKDESANATTTTNVLESPGDDSNDKP